MPRAGAASLLSGMVGRALAGEVLPCCSGKFPWVLVPEGAAGPCSTVTVTTIKSVHARLMEELVTLILMG